MLGFILWFSLSLGIQEQKPLEYPFYAEISIHAENEYVDIYGIYKNEMIASFPYFEPRQDTFIVGVKVGNDNLSINAEHGCSHSVNPFGNNRFSRDSGYNRLWVTISSKGIQ
jgi:hypothetical protein